MREVAVSTEEPNRRRAEPHVSPAPARDIRQVTRLCTALEDRRFVGAPRQKSPVASVSIDAMLRKWIRAPVVGPGPRVPEKCVTPDVTWTMP
jgi:hypothetical protein